MKRYFTSSVVIHGFILFLIGGMSMAVYDQIEYEKTAREVEKHTANYRQAKMRKMVDEMEVIRDIMKQIEEASDPEKVLEETTEEPAAETSPPEPEGQSENEEPNNSSEDLIEEAEQLEKDITESYKNILENSGFEIPTSLEAEIPSGSSLGEGEEGEGDGTGNGEGNGASESEGEGIASMRSEARSQLQQAITTQDGLDNGANLSPADAGTGVYWSDFALDRLGGANPEDFVASLDASELSRNMNQRSERLDNHQLRREINGAHLRPARSFLGTGDKIEWSYIDTWYVIGPFPNADREHHATSFPPETIVDLDATYEGRNREGIKWKYLQNPTPQISPSTMDEYTIHYAYTELRSDRERKVWLALGSDDSVRAWLNDTLIWESDTLLKEWNIADGFTQVTLKPGYNKLLLRHENDWGPGFYSAAIRIEN